MLLLPQKLFQSQPFAFASKQVDASPLSNLLSGHRIIQLYVSREDASDFCNWFIFLMRYISLVVVGYMAFAG
jgi:hypothetical protein